MELNVTGVATAEFGDRNAAPGIRSLNDGQPIRRTANITVEINGDVDDQARDEIYRVLHREAERIAQKAAVSARDAVIGKREAERIRQLPKDRSHVIVGAGSKDPDSVQVLRGSVKIGGRMLSAPKPTKGEQ